jgi:hypothetical protein
VFGEDENDTKVIQELLIALCPEFERMIKVFRKPPILMKDCDSSKLPDRVEIIRRLIDAEQTTSDVICVFAHEDCDNVEPAHLELAKRIEDGFSAAGYHVHAVTPAWEMEAWLFLWPEAVAAFRPSWRSLDRYRGRNVGRIQNAKEELARSVRPVGRAASRAREYRESDAPIIARRIREMGLADSPAGQSDSYDMFRARSRQCCERLRT